MSILWFVGPDDSRWTGVYRYSSVLFNGISDQCGSISVVGIPFKSRSVWRYLYQFLLFPVMLLFWRIFRQLKVCVLYQEDLSFMIPIARLLGVRVIVICHHVPELRALAGIERIKSFYLSTVFRFLHFASVVVVPSESTRASLNASYGISLSFVYVIPNAFEFSSESSRLAECERNSLFEKYNIDQEVKRVFLNVGTNESRKNLHVWFDAFSKDFKRGDVYIQIGKVLNEAERSSEIEAVSSDCLPVYFLGYVDEQDLERFYRSADFYVSPSLHEGFGRTVVEAQYYGATVVASKLDIYDEVLGGIYRAIDSPEDVSRWCDFLLNSQVYSDSEALSARNNSMRYTANTVVNQFLDVLRGVRG